MSDDVRHELHFPTEAARDAAIGPVEKLGHVGGLTAAFECDGGTSRYLSYGLTVDAEDVPALIKLATKLGAGLEEWVFTTSKRVLVRPRSRNLTKYLEEGVY